MKEIPSRALHRSTTELPLLGLTTKAILYSTKMPSISRRLELIGFDRGYRVSETIGTFIGLQKTLTSGVIVNTSSTDWCSEQWNGWRHPAPRLKRLRSTRSKNCSAAKRFLRTDGQTSHSTSPRPASTIILFSVQSTNAGPDITSGTTIDYNIHLVLKVLIDLLGIRGILYNYILMLYRG